MAAAAAICLCSAAAVAQTVRPGGGGSILPPDAEGFPQDAGTLSEASPFEDFTAQLGSVVGVIRSQCRSPTTTELGAWCATYTAIPTGKPDKWDLVAVLSSRTALLTVFLSEQDELMEALRGFSRSFGPVVPPGLEKDFGTARKASGELREKSLAPGALPEPVGLANPEVLLDRLFGGIALALQKRAQEEAVDYALHTIQENVCDRDAFARHQRTLAQAKKKRADAEARFAADRRRLDELEATRRTVAPDAMPAVASSSTPAPRPAPADDATVAAALAAVNQSRTLASQAVEEALQAKSLQPRDLLPNTCRLADAEAFSGSGSGSGLASLEMLRAALREDLLSMPAGLTAEVIRQSLESIEIPAGMNDAQKEKIAAARERVALAVRSVVERVVRRQPTFAPVWEQLARELADAAKSEPEGAPEREPLRWIALAVDAPPGIQQGWGLVLRNAWREPREVRAASTALLLLRRPVFAPARHRLGLEDSPDAQQWIAFYLRASRAAALASESIARAAELLAASEAQLAQAVPDATASAALIKSAEALEKDATDTAKAQAVRLREAAAAAAEAPARARAAGLAAANVFAVLQAASEAVELVAALAPGDGDEVVRKVRQVVASAGVVQQTVSAAVVLDMNGVFQQLVRFARDDQQSCPAGFGCIRVSRAVLQFSGMAVSLASAKSSQEVSDVLLAASAPVGTWRVKYNPANERKRLTTTLGGLVGMRLLHRNPTPDSPRGLRAPEISAPVGVDLAWPIAEKLYLAGFGQLLDLGSYLDFGGDRHSTPRVLQGVSPGVLARVGLFGTPLSVAAGVAYDLDAGGPAPADGSRPKGGWRFTLFGGVDVPLFILSR